MREKKHYPYAEFRNVSSIKRTRLSHKKSDNNVTSSSSSDNETTPKFKKSFGTNFNAKFDARMKTRCEFIIKADNELFHNKTRKPMFVLNSFQHLLKSNLDRLSLQQLECEIDSAGYPDKYNFKEEDHPFVSDALRDKNIQLVLLYFVYKPKTNTSRTKKL